MRRWIFLLVLGCGGDAADPYCYDDSKCATGRCILGRCWTGTGEVDAKCEFRADCKTRFCVAGRCATGERGARCAINADCTDDHCFDGRCTNENVGATCEDVDGECYGDGVYCFRHRCRRPGGAGDACDGDGDCTSGLTCVDTKCFTDEQVRAREAQLAEDARKAAAAEEARMLGESGVKADPKVVERVTPPPGRGQRVRTVTVTGRGMAFAACRADERLVGGGCKPDSAGYPSGFSADDTVGARWNCEGYEVTTYALCMKLP